MQATLDGELELAHAAFPDWTIEVPPQSSSVLHVTVNGGDFEIRLHFPPDYPACPCAATVYRAATATRAEEKSLLDSLIAIATSTAARKEPALFDVLQTVDAFRIDTAARRAEGETPPTPSRDAPRRPPCVVRQLIYSHHIIAAEKRAAIATFARELELGGLVKHGWPGLIVVEGDRDDVEEYVRRLRRFRWKHFEVRGEESEHEAASAIARVGAAAEADGGWAALQGEDTRAAAVDAHRRLPRGFEELGDGPEALGLAGSKCLAAGLGDLFKTFFR